MLEVRVSTSKLEKVLAAKAKLTTAEENLRQLIRQLYPIGSKLVVTLGQATVCGTVVGHGPSWCHPEEIYIVNDATKKERKVNVPFDKPNSVT